MAKALTDIAIKNLKPGVQRREIPDPGARGLYVIVQPTGVKGFAVRYRFAGHPRKFTLEAGISLAAARKATADAMYEVQQGRDPGAAKAQLRATNEQAEENTLRAVCDEYFLREGADLRSRELIEKSLKRLVYPTAIGGKGRLGDRQIESIRRSEIVKLLDKIEDESGPVMADRVLAYVRKILNWHATRSDDFKSPIVRGMARTKPKERARKRVLNDDELRAVWRTAEDFEGPFGYFVRFVLLTLARRNEASEMADCEVIGDDWIIPGSRYKTKLDHLIPLSPAARDLLASIPRVENGRNDRLFFTTDGHKPFSGFSKFKKEFDKVCGVKGWVIHDLRRTGRSLMSRAKIDADHAERCMGHVIGGVRETYDRYEYRDEKKQAFEALAALMRTVVVGPQNNIVPLIGGAR
jgi:integrase